MSTIVDTGPLVALLNRRDKYHTWITQTLRGIALPLWTCEPVLTEVAYLTGKPALVMAMLAGGELELGFDLATEAAGIRRLLLRYESRMDLADACVVRLSELMRDARVLTLDRTDFSIYRRNGRDVISLIAPER